MAATIKPGLPYSILPKTRRLVVGQGYAVIKRTMDILLSCLMLTLGLPFWLTIAVAIRLDSPGSALFPQWRHGRNGKIFKMYKFRTMHVHLCDDGSVQARKEDQRITPLGWWLRRTSIDELPQLINILKGEMSFVGPRPHPVPLDRFYGECMPHYWGRYHCKPGLTGWAQVNGLRGETQVQDMCRRMIHDLEYMHLRSFWFDLKILLQTAKMFVAVLAL